MRTDSSVQIAHSMLQCITELGDLQTNSVLLALDGSQSVKPYQHYPEKPYQFGCDHWRAYYHSHGAPGADQAEHGHFHFFSRSASDKNDWAHVIGLGMDGYGQVLRLFTTNLWVTEGDWFTLDKLDSAFERLAEEQSHNLALNWFKNILLLYKEEILELIQQRDVKVASLYPNSREQCFLDRSIYYLSEQEIDLNKKLMDQI